MSYSKKTLLLIVLATTIRCLTASGIELGNDEVYYRMYAQHLQWNYFDHPPMVGWLIRISTFDLHFTHELFIRLGAIISAGITTWIIFLTGKKIKDAYTGFLAAILYTASVYGSIIAGIFILPDSPQMICWAAGIYFLTEVVKGNDINQAKKRDLLLFGMVTGVGMLCKIHSAFLWIGLLWYIIRYNRAWLTQPALYLSGIISLVIFFPVIQWNINNHFVTYLFHSKRVDITDGGIDISSCLTFLAGQVFYTNPIIFVLALLATRAAYKNKLIIDASQKRLLLLCSLPLIVLTSFISLCKQVLPHWTGPAFYALILLTACWLSEQQLRLAPAKKNVPRSLLAACTLQLCIVITGVLLVNFMPGTLGRKDKWQWGEGDFTLDMYGWSTIKKEFKKIVDTDTRSGAMKTNAAIISNKWFPAAHIDHYIAMPLQKELVAIGDTGDIHQYAWINQERRQLQAGDDAYYIVPSNNYVDVREKYAAHFMTILPPLVIEQQRSGKTCRYFYIWRMQGFIPKKNLRVQ